MQTGVIGLGRMGGGMARRLLSLGHAVAGYDVDPAALNAFAQAGGRPLSSPAEVADVAEIVLASLPSLAASEAAALGSDGVVQGGKVRIYVETSTVGPSAVRTLAAGLKAAGDITLLDAPVSGGAAGAEAGTLTTVVAGPQWAFEAATRILTDVASKSFRVGDEPGLGQLFKVINNYIVMSSMAVTCEAIAVGVRSGADEAQLIEVINNATGRNYATSSYFPTMILPRDYRGRLTMALKDVKLFVSQAAEVGLTSDIADTLVATWSAAEDLGLGIGSWYETLRAPP